MKILIVLTSHSELGNTGEKTGFWVEEFAAPYYVLADAGAVITIASPAGGQPPVDPKSEAADAQTLATERFYKDNEAIDKVACSLQLSDIKAEDYDAVFYPGGHGPLWDLANDPFSIKLIEDFYNTQKPVAFVCHAPAALINVKAENGHPLVKGKKLTGFSDTEEEAVGLTKVVPFLLEDALKKLGAHYSKGADWSSYTQHDGLLITGQNPASSEAVAKLLLKTLAGEKENHHSKIY
ncbi:MAG: type 1 glutamine amidotransferase domain-containing protein [Ferruginibacter sp.]